MVRRDVGDEGRPSSDMDDDAAARRRRSRLMRKFAKIVLFSLFLL